ncbi:hypothetical protein Lalb_Chr23g0275051 [Lupinus albus]|uniref:Uncharacterized protein n=1 Tax=Lupinus albus TaxID=3870 RepID=A0A6A4NJ80_LUPAL|nr:hypothetical protein Lalb_Chr23g0275051 [Lupinus albus]
MVQNRDHPGLFRVSETRLFYHFSIPAPRKLPHNILISIFILSHTISHQYTSSYRYL